MDIQLTGALEKYKQQFDEDQLVEIELGLAQGIDVDIYAKPQLLPLQMEAIRLGLEKGLDMAEYATGIYDWFQLDEIRLGLEFNLPVSRYADPKIPHQKMRQIRLGLAEGIDMGRQTQLDWKTLEQIRLANHAGISLNTYIQKGYDAEQLEQIRLAKEEGIDLDPYLQPSYRGIALEQIRLGLSNFIDVSQYAKPYYNWQQMREVRLGLEEQLDASQYNHHLYNWKQMQEVRLGLADGLNVRAYNSLMYTESYMHRMRRALLETYDIVGTNAKHEITNEQFTIQIDDNAMEAIFTLKTPIRGRSRTKMRHILESNGIRSGIQDQVLQELVSEHKIGHPYRIAVGKEPIHGEDGYYTFSFDTSTLGNTRGTDGTLDLSQAPLFRMVKKGEKIAIYHPAREGRDGYTVLGDTLPGLRGKEMTRLHGKGILLLPDKVTYQSLLDGCVKYVKSEDSLDVFRMTVLGNINSTTGDIQFKGNVYVSGDIGNSVTIQATEDIIVDGNVEAATLKAGHNIYLKKGISGHKRGSLIAKGDIEAGFCESAKIQCKGNFKTNYCMDCEVNVEGSAEILGKRGVIIGGYFQCQKGIRCAAIGNSAGSSTKIRLGMTDQMTEQVKRLLMADDKVRKELKLLNSGLDKFKARYSAEVYDGIEMYKKIEDAIYTKTLEMEKLNEAEARLEDYLQEIKNAKIMVEDMVYPGVVVHIEDMIWNATESRHVSIQRAYDHISVTRMEDNR